MWQPIATSSTYSESVNSFKVLGAHITKDLSWAVHFNCVIKKASRRLYSLRNLRKSGVHLDDLIIVYCSHIRSVLEYAATALANQGRIQDFFRRGCTRLWLYFNTNKPHSFFFAEYQLY